MKDNIFKPRGYSYQENPETGDIYAIDDRTGEVHEAVLGYHILGSYYRTPAQVEIDRERRMQRKAFFEAKQRKNKLGKFFFVRIEDAFNRISPETMARLLLLGTYLQYNKTTLMVTQRKAMEKDDLPAVLGLSRTTTNRFLAEVSPQYLSINDDNSLSMNTPLITFGKMDTKQARQKVFHTLRMLYLSLPKSKHRYLGYIFKMIPYINIEYNVLCRNIFETELDKIHMITDKEFCRMIGYDCSAVSRLRKCMEEIKFRVCDHEEPFCMFVSAGKRTWIAINPRIIYGGRHSESVTLLANFCKADDNDTEENSTNLNKGFFLENGEKSPVVEEILQGIDA